MTAKERFPRLYAEIIAAAAADKAARAHYIDHGFLPSWSAEHRQESDTGIERYSTPRRWEQYTAGEISRETAVELATRRACKQIDKSTAKKHTKLEAAAAAPGITSASITVTWAKSRTWGANPTAEVLITGEGRTTGHASGCGYDKESAAIASAMNESPAALAVLFELAEAALARGESPHSETACTGYHWGPCIGYGAGYAVLPYYEGGVGTACYWAILEKAGYKVRHAGGSKMVDVWTIEKTEGRAE